MALRRMGRPGLVGTAARTAVVVGTAQAVTGKSAARQAAATPPVSPAPAEPPAPPVAGATVVDPGQDLISQLERLAQLSSSGMLTAEEFSAAKARLLA